MDVEFGGAVCTVSILKNLDSKLSLYSIFCPHKHKRIFYVTTTSPLDAAHNDLFKTPEASIIN